MYFSAAIQDICLKFLVKICVTNKPFFYNYFVCSPASYNFATHGCNLPCLKYGKHHKYPFLRGCNYSCKNTTIDKSRTMTLIAQQGYITIRCVESCVGGFPQIGSGPQRIYDENTFCMLDIG